MGVGAATFAALEPACCSGRDKYPVHIDPVLDAAVDLHFGPPRQVLQPADESAWSLYQEDLLYGNSHQQESRERLAEVHNVSRVQVPNVCGAQVPTPTVQEFQSARMLDGQESAKPTTNTNTWHDYSFRSCSIEEEATSSNQFTQPRLGVRSVTLDFSLSARAIEKKRQEEMRQNRVGLQEAEIHFNVRPGTDRSVPDPPLAWTAKNTPLGYEQHGWAKAKAQLMRKQSAPPLKRQTSGESASGGTSTPRGDADWTGMAKRMQQQWTRGTAEKRRRVFESPILEDKLANRLQQQLVKERSGVGAVWMQQNRSVQRDHIAIVDKALEIRLAQQRLKAEGQSQAMSALPEGQATTCGASASSSTAEAIA